MDHPVYEIKEKEINMLILFLFSLHNLHTDWCDGGILFLVAENMSRSQVCSVLTCCVTAVRLIPRSL
jgi:hypothetical protein